MERVNMWLRFFVAAVFAVAFLFTKPNFTAAMEKEELEKVTAEIQKLESSGSKEDKELAEAMKEELVKSAENGELDVNLGDRQGDNKTLTDLSTQEGKQKALETIQTDYDSGKSGMTAEKLTAIKEAISGYTDEKSFEEKMKALFEGEHQGESHGEALGKEGDFKEFMKTFEGKDHAEFAKEAVLEALEKSGAEGMEKFVGHELSDQEKADAELFRSGTEADRTALMEKYGQEHEGTFVGQEREMASMEREMREVAERSGFDRETMEREARERGWEPPSENRDPAPPPPPMPEPPPQR